jgi:hypothetical protein
MLITSKKYAKKERNKPNYGTYTNKGLWDINENKAFAQFLVYSKLSTTYAL